MSGLDEIKERIADCASYNFGMRNADQLAHEDAPRLVAALEEVRVILSWFDSVEEFDPTRRDHLNISAGGAAATIRKRIELALDGKA